MTQCALCNGRLIQTQFGHRCMNNSCENSKAENKAGHLCLVCNESLQFRRNNAYGDRVYYCPECKKELVI